MTKILAYPMNTSNIRNMFIYTIYFILWEGKLWCKNKFINRLKIKNYESQQS
jgi:hypothetical protein